MGFWDGVAELKNSKGEKGYVPLRLLALAIPIINLPVAIIEFINSFKEEKGLTLKIFYGIWTIFLLVGYIWIGVVVIDAIQEKNFNEAQEQKLYDSSLLEINVENKENIDEDTFNFKVNYRNNNWNRIVGCDIEFAVYNYSGVELLKATITEIDCFENQDASYNYSARIDDTEKATELYNTAYEYLEIRVTIKMLRYNRGGIECNFDDYRVLKTVDTDRLEAAYVEAVEIYNSGDYNQAIEKFSVLGSYKESSAYLINSYTALENSILEETYLYANDLYNNKQYLEAYEKFSEIKEYKDSQALMNSIMDDVGDLAEQYANIGDYESACNTLFEMGFSANTYDPNYLSILEAYYFAYIGKYRNATLCGLSKIVIPYGVSEIGDFQGCTDLVEIIMPDSVTNISGYAFSECISLTSITLSPNIKIIDSYAFSDCTALTDLEIPFGVEYIGMNAFSNCISLKKIMLPTSLKCFSVKGWNSFGGEIHYAGTVEQWEKVTKDHIFMATLNKPVYCSNGTVEP